MNGLDGPPGPRDPSGMAGLVAGAPEQIESARERLAAHPWPRPARSPDLVAVGAMGGSAIAADLTAALYAPRLPRPLVVVRDYRWPAWAGPATLAVLASYSGETEETLSLYEHARERGMGLAALTTGGTLARWCERDGVPFATLPGGMPPRAAMYSSWVALTGLLATMDWIDDPAREWRDAAAELRGLATAWGPEAAEERNPAKRIARAIHGRFPFLYGAEALAPLLTRWRNQFNENAKLLGHSAVVPEMNHNEVVGWEKSDPPGGETAALFMSDGEESPRVRLRLALTAEYLAGRGVEVVHAPVPGGGRLARWAGLALLGDYLSLYLAMLRGVDPTPIASLDEFKRRLSESGAPHPVPREPRSNPNP